MTDRLTTAIIQPDEMPGYQDAWDELYRADPEAHYFLSRDFIEPIVAASPKSHVFVAVIRGQRMLALVPLWVRLIWDRRRQCYRSDLLFTGAKNWADYNGFLIDADAEDAAIDALAAFFTTHPWARFRLKNLSMSAARQSRFFGAFQSRAFGSRPVSKMINGGQTNNLLCPVISLPDSFDAYLAGLSRNTRQKLRRCLRALDGGIRDNSSGGLRIRTGTADDLPGFAAMWARQWARKPDPGRLSQTYAATLKQAMDRGTLSFPVLERDGEPLGYLASFLDPVKKSVLFFVSAREPQVHDVSVGLIMHADAIRRAIADGYRRYDMLRGDEPYKMQLGGVIHEIRYTVLRRRSHVNPRECLSPLSRAKLTHAAQDTADPARAETARRQLRDL